MKPLLRRTVRSGQTLAALGHIDAALLERIGVSQGSDFYLCGPTSFLQNMRDGLRTWGVLARECAPEIFGALESITPGFLVSAIATGPNVCRARYSFRASGISSLRETFLYACSSPLDLGAILRCGAPRHLGPRIRMARERTVSRRSGSTCAPPTASVKGPASTSLRWPATGSPP